MFYWSLYVLTRLYIRLLDKAIAHVSFVCMNYSFLIDRLCLSGIVLIVVVHNFTVVDRVWTMTTVRMSCIWLKSVEKT